MPFSKKQQIVARIAEHNPSALKPENRGMLSMDHAELHKFATGPIEKPSKKSSGFMGVSRG